VPAKGCTIPLSLKRRLSRRFERLTGNLVIPCEELHLVHERVHLRRLFTYLGVDCVFDVGASRGQYAKMLRDPVGIAGRSSRTSRSPSWRLSWVRFPRSIPIGTS
jgi:hypothetical protein